MNRSKRKHFPLPAQKGDALPPPGFFEGDDFMRARYFSAVIERYANRAETQALVTFARERRMPGMSFADALEAMASYLHRGPDNAIERLIAQTKKPKEQYEREFQLTEAVHEVLKSARTSEEETAKAVFRALFDRMRAIYPKATEERIKGALAAGNTTEGFSVPAVVEAMALTEDANEAAKCPECNGVTVMTRGKGTDTQYMICTRWKQPGHLDQIDIEMRVRELRKELRPSGRFA